MSCLFAFLTETASCTITMGWLNKIWTSNCNYILITQLERQISMHKSLTEGYWSWDCDQKCPVNVFPPGMQSGGTIYVRQWSSCDHLSDARRNERWFLSKAPHRVQSHYRACQMKLVPEFATREKGQVRQHGESIKWVSWWKKVWGPKLTKCKERPFFLHWGAQVTLLEKVHFSARMN